MKRELEKFGFFAPPAPPKRVTPAVDSPLLLSDFVKAEHDDNDMPADPVGAFVQKAALEEQKKSATTSTGDFDLLKALSEADVRDREPTITVLRKDAAVPDWSWSSPVSSDSPLEKRATPARAKLNILLDRIFGNHQDFRTEAAEIVDQALSDERAAILAEA